MPKFSCPLLEWRADLRKQLYVPWSDLSGPHRSDLVARPWRRERIIGASTHLSVSVHKTTATTDRPRITGCGRAVVGDLGVRATGTSGFPDRHKETRAVPVYAARRNQGARTGRNYSGRGQDLVCRCGNSGRRGCRMVADQGLGSVEISLAEAACGLSSFADSLSAESADQPTGACTECRLLHGRV